MTARGMPIPIPGTFGRLTLATVSATLSQTEAIQGDSMRRRTLLASIAAAALVVTACGSSTPTLDDPKEILSKAVEKTRDATSFHLALTLDGEISLDLLGTGSTSPMTLAGTKLEGDVDVANGGAKLSLAVPALFGLTGEVILVDGFAYLKTSLTGAKYQKSEVTEASPDPSPSGDMLGDLEAFLERPEIDPKKGADTKCGDADCYTVTIELTAEELAALSSDAPDALPSLPIPEIDAGTLTLTILVEKASLHVASVAATIDLGDAGSITLGVEFSKWDETVTISPPPDDEVEEGGGLFD